MTPAEQIDLLNRIVDNHARAWLKAGASNNNAVVFDPFARADAEHAVSLSKRLKDEIRTAIENTALSPFADWAPKWLREFHCQCEPDIGEAGGRCVACQAADYIARVPAQAPLA